MLSRKWGLYATTALFLTWQNASAAHALGRSLNVSAPAATTASPGSSIVDEPTLTNPAVVAGGDYFDGFSLGERNGTVLVDRLKQRTTDQLGCSGIAPLKRALLAVTRTVRAPSSHSDAFVAGFYSGYLGSVRSTLTQVRQGCDAVLYDGDFVGSLYGAVACQVASVSIDAIISLDLNPLYSGWSGGSEAESTVCHSTLRATVESCTDGVSLSTELETALSVSCSDSSLL